MQAQVAHIAKSGATLAETVRQNNRPHLHSFYGHTLDTYDMAYHAHAAVEIMYAVSGRCQIPVRTRTGLERELTLREGQFVLLDAWTEHRLIITPDHPCRLYMLEMLMLPDDGAPRLGTLAAACPPLLALIAQCRPWIKLDDHGSVIQAISLLQNERERYAGQPGHPAMMEALFTQFFIELARSGEWERQRSGYGHVQKAIRIIQTSFDRPLTAAAVATQVGIHPAHLERLFRHHQGQTLHDFVNRLRLEKACLLLLNSSLAVIDIAVSTGFNSRQNFTRAFRLAIGLTPRDYRIRRGSLAILPGEREGLPPGSG